MKRRQLLSSLALLIAVDLGCGARTVALEPEVAAVRLDGGVPRRDVDLRPPDLRPPVDGPSPDALDPRRDLGVAPERWLLLPAGSYVMGAPDSEPCTLGYATQHPVTLTHAIAISATEVTQGQFAVVMRYNPSHFQSCGSSCPVERVTMPAWPKDRDDATGFRCVRTSF